MSVEVFTVAGNEVTMEHLVTEKNVGQCVYLIITPPHFENGGFIQNWSKKEWPQVVEKAKEFALSHPQFPPGAKLTGRIYDLWSEDGLMRFNVA